MDKRIIFEQLKKEIEKNLELAIKAAENTYDIATHEENKAENKYDTRGLEASYLAGAQAERVRELRETLGVISNLKMKPFADEDKIALTALIKISSSEKELWLLLLPKGGGQSCSFQGQLIQVITPESPLGKGLIGREVEDTVQVKDKTYEIEQIL